MQTWLLCTKLTWNLNKYPKNKTHECTMKNRHVLLIKSKVYYLHPSYVLCLIQFENLPLFARKTSTHTKSDGHCLSCIRTLSTGYWHSKRHVHEPRLVPKEKDINQEGLLISYKHCREAELDPWMWGRHLFACFCGKSDFTNQPGVCCFLFGILDWHEVL